MLLFSSFLGIKTVVTKKISAGNSCFPEKCFQNRDTRHGL